MFGVVAIFSLACIVLGIEMLDIENDVKRVDETIQQNQKFLEYLRRHLNNNSDYEYYDTNKEKSTIHNENTMFQENIENNSDKRRQMNSDINYSSMLQINDNNNGIYNNENTLKEYFYERRKTITPIAKKVQMKSQINGNVIGNQVSQEMLLHEMSTNVLDDFGKNDGNRKDYVETIDRNPLVVVTSKINASPSEESKKHFNRYQHNKRHHRKQKPSLLRNNTKENNRYIMQVKEVQNIDNIDQSRLQNYSNNIMLQMYDKMPTSKCTKFKNKHDQFSFSENDVDSSRDVNQVNKQAEVMKKQSNSKNKYPLVIKRQKIENKMSKLQKNIENHKRFKNSNKFLENDLFQTDTKNSTRHKDALNKMIQTLDKYKMNYKVNVQDYSPEIYDEDFSRKVKRGRPHFRGEATYINYHNNEKERLQKDLSEQIKLKKSLDSIFNVGPEKQSNSNKTGVKISVKPKKQNFLENKYNKKYNGKKNDILMLMKKLLSKTEHVQKSTSSFHFASSNESVQFGTFVTHPAQRNDFVLKALEISTKHPMDTGLIFYPNLNGVNGPNTLPKIMDLASLIESIRKYQNMSTAEILGGIKVRIDDQKIHSFSSPIVDKENLHSIKLIGNNNIKNMTPQQIDHFTTPKSPANFDESYTSDISAAARATSDSVERIFIKL